MACLFVVFLAAFWVSSCISGNGTEPDPNDAIASVVVTPPQATVGIGATTEFSATVRNGRGDIVQVAVDWSSSAPDIAVVDQNIGSVRGVSAGIATISATAGGQTGSASVTVRLLPGDM